MQKAFLLCLFLFSLTLCDDFVRVATSCPNGFFNNQICVPCASQGCTCTKYKGCDQITCLSK